MTVVLDASVMAELLLFTDGGRRAAERIRKEAGALHLPHLADSETTSVLRRLVRSGGVVADRAAQALVDLRDFPAERWPAGVLLDRIWMLRDNVAAYDATYIALAEELEADFVTTDERLARAVANVARCTVEVV